MVLTTEEKNEIVAEVISQLGYTPITDKQREEYLAWTAIDPCDKLPQWKRNKLLKDAMEAFFGYMLGMQDYMLRRDEATAPTELYMNDTETILKQEHPDDTELNCNM